MSRPTPRCRGIYITICLLYSQLQQTSCEGVSLSKLNIDSSRVTVSGISSGAAMATQFHFAHSSEVSGAGLFAGVPFMCGWGGLTAAYTCMDTPLLVNVPWLITEISSVESVGNIDSTGNLHGNKVFIFHGSADSTVRPASGPNIERMYRHYGAQIKTKFDLKAEHGQPTENYGAACDKKSEEFGFINKCSYHGTFEMLNHLYNGNLTRPGSQPGHLEPLQIFDQSEFFNYNPAISSMDGTGFLYVPSRCKSGESCSLHFAFHGCKQYQGVIGDTFPTKSGYLEVAEENNIVLIFPQTVPQLPGNPNGCWDWWGYLTNLFPTKHGNQILAVYRMMKRVIEG